MNQVPFWDYSLRCISGYLQRTFSRCPFVYLQRTVSNSISGYLQRTVSNSISGCAAAYPHCNTQCIRCGPASFHRLTCKVQYRRGRTSCTIYRGHPSIRNTNDNDSSQWNYVQWSVRSASPSLWGLNVHHVITTTQRFVICQTGPKYASTDYVTLQSSRAGKSEDTTWMHVRQRSNATTFDDRLTMKETTLWSIISYLLFSF